MQVDLNNWQAFEIFFLQPYRRYQICKKATAVAHGYGASANHAHETDTQVMIEDELKALANVKMEDNEAMANLTRINLTIYQSLTQAQEKHFVL